MLDPFYFHFCLLCPGGFVVRAGNEGLNPIASPGLIGKSFKEAMGYFMTQDPALAALEGLRKTPTTTFKHLAEEYGCPGRRSRPPVLARQLLICRRWRLLESPQSGECCTLGHEEAHRLFERFPD